MSFSNFILKRLRVIRKGKVVYDQNFHSGVNIIRGENGSGKSTIADFIFYILGGEFDNWKTAAATCDEVQAEVTAHKATLTLRRAVGKSLTEIDVYFGAMEEAQEHALDVWEKYPIHRQEKRESFSQIMFRAAGIPEAQSQSTSNITMHQLLRLLYADQRTPSAFLFRYEPFDTPVIREAVGDLVCGLSVYELYEIELALRSLEKEFDEKSRKLAALLDALPHEEALSNLETINLRDRDLIEESQRLTGEINSAEEHVDTGQEKAFVDDRAKAVAEIRKSREQMREHEQQLYVQNLEIDDLNKFLEYLEELSDKLPKVQLSSELIGSIEFTHCPACLSELSENEDPERCALCGASIDPERERSRYLQVKLDTDIQIRESRQLLDSKQQAVSRSKQEIRRLRRYYQEQLSEYRVKYELSTSPRDSFVAERFLRLGQIDRERSELDRFRERALEISFLSEEKSTLQAQLSRLKDRQQALQRTGRRRRHTALMLVSATARAILRQDLERQDEFKNAQHVDVNFRDNSIFVDQELNFAESSNVFVKNSIILSILLAATKDRQFYHPRFALFDNIEDKGMERERSHNFQRIIVQASEELEVEHQIIFTTSMFNPDLNEKRFAVGPHYTHEHRTLAVQDIE
ncbi:AAA family ATPase [Algihabitans albus]|uniref:hypothetical protein n=1 Tax=Algihabitans albus TaxID=2164067 RepID=UPI0035CFD8A9